MKKTGSGNYAGLQNRLDALASAAAATPWVLLSAWRWRLARGIAPFVLTRIVGVLLRDMVQGKMKRFAEYPCKKRRNNKRHEERNVKSPSGCSTNLQPEGLCNPEPRTAISVLTYTLTGPAASSYEDSRSVKSSSIQNIRVSPLCKSSSRLCEFRP